MDIPSKMTKGSIPQCPYYISEEMASRSDITLTSDLCFPPGRCGHPLNGWLYLFIKALIMQQQQETAAKTLEVSLTLLRGVRGVRSEVWNRSSWSGSEQPLLPFVRAGWLKWFHSASYRVIYPPPPQRRCELRLGVVGVGASGAAPNSIHTISIWSYVWGHWLL